MRFCRYDNDRLGVVRGDLVHDVSSVLDKLPAVRWPLPAYDPLIAALPTLRGDMEAAADRAQGVPISSVKLLNPVPNPSKVIGAPVNYHAHIDEANADAQINFGKTIKTIDHYGVFLKSNSYRRAHPSRSPLSRRIGAPTTRPNCRRSSVRNVSTCRKRVR